MTTTQAGTLTDAEARTLDSYWRAANAAADTDADISAPSAAVSTLVITAREDVEIARQVRAVLGLTA